MGSSKSSTQLLPIPILVTSYVVTMVLVVTSNLLVIAVVATGKHMKSTTNIFICSLSVADLIIALFVIPSSTADSVENVRSPYHCLVVPYVQLLSISASIFSLIAIAVDRFRAVARPTSPPLNSFVGVLLVWTLAAVYALRTFLPGLIPHDDDDHHDDHDTTIHSATTNAYTTSPEYDEDDHHDEEVCNILVDEAVWNIFYRVADFVCIFLLPMFILIALYTVTIWRLEVTAKAPTGHSSVAKRKRGIIKMCVVVVVVFFLCWAPYHIADLVHDGQEYARSKGGSEDHEDTAWFNSVRFVTVIIALSNSWMSPVIYAIFSSQFRKEMVTVLTCKLWRDSKIQPSVSSKQNSDPSK